MQVVLSSIRVSLVSPMQRFSRLGSVVGPPLFAGFNRKSKVRNISIPLYPLSLGS
jgi:hypothetical protein